VVVMKGPEPEWDRSDKSVNLCVRTKIWPIVTLWVRGLSADARHPSNGGGIDELVCDGRWILESAGPGVQGQPTDVSGQTYFINRKLYKTIDS